MERVAVFVLASVPVISLVAVGLLVCGVFNAERALVIGIPLAFWLSRPLLSVSNAESRWPTRAKTSLILLLLVAALLRFPPSVYLQAAGDPGVYMSMAGYFADKGTLDVTDAVRAKLVSPEAVARFDANNVTPFFIYRPGIFADPDTPGHYTFQFYDVHPLWLAIFAGVLGLHYMAWSQLFFALLSLFFAALVAERLTHDWRAGLAFAGILTVLPLHVYFSKLPISEMPTLAFAFMAVYCLLRGADDRLRSRWLVLSALAFATLFLTRISGFVYLPVLYIGALISHVFVDDARLRRRWGFFWFSLFVAYAVSVIYGLVWSGPYSHGIYSMHFGERVTWVPWMLGGLALICAAPFVVFRAEPARLRMRSALHAGWMQAQRFGPLLFVAFLLVGAARAGLLAFTDYYKGNAWYDQLWGLSHAGSDAVLRSALLVTAEHVGPIAVLLLPFALWKPGVSASRALLVVMVLATIGYTAGLQWFLPFQYYYSRYLLSEVVPFALLLLVVRAADGWQIVERRRWIVAALVGSCAYFSWFTWPLIGLDEAAGAETSLERIASQLDRASVLLVDETHIQDASRFVTPLRLWFGKSVYSISNMAGIPAIVQDLRRAGIRDVLLLGDNGGVPAPFVFKTRIRFEETATERSPWIPRRTDVDTTDFVLSQLDDNAFAATLLTGAGLGIADFPPGCCQGFYPDKLWSEAHASIDGITLPKGFWRRLVVTLRGYRPDNAQSALAVRMNGKELHLDKSDGRTFEFLLGPIEGPLPFELQLDTKPFVPREVGLNDDRRSLGIDIATLRVD